MPYIDKTRRDTLLASNSPQTSGELNFLITTIIINYVEEKGRCYDTLNSVIGVLECVKLELNRRVIASYEDGKIAFNGDVYPESLID